MTDFFSRLAERALGIALTIQPGVAPRYAPELQRADEDVPGIQVDKEHEQAAQCTTFIAPMPAIQREQASATPPQARHTRPSFSPPEATMQSAQADSKQTNTTLPASDVPLTRESAAHATPQTYPLLQRPAQPQNSGIEQHVTSISTTNAVTTTSAHNITAYTTVQNVLPRAIEQLHEHGDVHTPSLSKQREHHLTMTATTSSIDKGEAPAPVTRQRQEIIGNGVNSSVPVNRRQYGQYIQHVQLKEEEQVTPTIQVTIGRIEVRATTSPVPTVQSQRQQVAPPVMSLDDYLHQRAKGER
jgi:hypothetical protein